MKWGVSTVLPPAASGQEKEVGLEEVTGEGAGKVEMVSSVAVLKQGPSREEGEVDEINNSLKAVVNQSAGEDTWSSSNS